MSRSSAPRPTGPGRKRALAFAADLKNQEDHNVTSRRTRGLTQHRFLHLECLEPRICLSGSYGFSIIDAAGVGVTGFEASASINDSGQVAYVSHLDIGQAIFVGDGSSLANVTPGFQSEPRTFRSGLEINNRGQVAAVDRTTLPGSNGFRLRLWEPNGDNTILARASVPRFPGDDYDALASFVSLSEDGSVAFQSITGNIWTSHLLSGGTILDVKTLVAPDNFGRPVTANGDILLARWGNDGGDPLQLSKAGLFGLSHTDIATAFSETGRAPGINDDGSLVSFYGVADHPGIYVHDQRTGDMVTVAATGTHGNDIIEPWEYFDDKNGDLAFDTNADEDAPLFNRFDIDSRVAVNLIEDQAATVAYVAYRNDGDREVKGLYTSRIFFPSDGSSIRVGAPRLVAEVDMELPGLGKIRDLATYDPLNNNGQGDVAFWAETTEGGGEAIVKATWLPPAVLNVVTHGFNPTPPDLPLGVGSSWSSFAQPGTKWARHWKPCRPRVHPWRVVSCLMSPNGIRQVAFCRPSPRCWAPRSPMRPRKTLRRKATVQKQITSRRGIPDYWKSFRRILRSRLVKPSWRFSTSSTIWKLNIWEMSQIMNCL